MICGSPGFVLVPGRAFDVNRLIEYWPSPEAVNSCIRTEAETLDDAVLLAVHEPLPLQVREAGTGAVHSKTEKDLLDAFLAPADDGSSIVVAITGDSGVGKSHMIRWLHAQLQRHPDRKKFVIVVVPKTASLRKVVKLMLEPLEQRERDRLTHELARVTESLNDHEASRQLATALTNELNRCSREWHDQLRAKVSRGEADPYLQERMYHAKKLPTILFNNELFERWFEPVLTRIVRQAIEGGSEAASGDARRFILEDFDLPDGFDVTSVDHAAQLYINQLQSSDGVRKREAVTVLQEQLDAALRSVFRFSEALGQLTLEDVVNQIREQLLREGKELVLLIEDFAALAGIQETLLNLMISESDHHGQRVRAPIRTALAVTDGFLPSKQTILTRAKREWIIPNSVASEDEIVQRFVRMTGRYLNAARWNVDELRSQFRASADGDLYGWMQAFDVETLSDEEQSHLDAFGRTALGHALFPLTEVAVRSLVRYEMTVRDNIVFNPRKFINSVLRSVLEQRGDYERGNFPPPGFKEVRMKTNAALELTNQNHQETVRARLEQLIAVWGGNPSSLGEAPIVGRAIFSAFGLPWPFTTSVETPRNPPGVIQVTRDPNPRPLVEAPHIQAPVELPVETPGLAEDLERWVDGSLSQQRALMVRGLLAEALNERMEWNSLRMIKGQIRREFFWLPFVTVGNPQHDPKFVVAEEKRPIPAATIRGIIAIDRWHRNDRSWDFARSEEDFPYAQMILDRLEKQARDYFLGRAVRKVASIGQAMHHQSLLLGACEQSNLRNAKLSSVLASVAVPEIPELLAAMPHVGQTLQSRRNASIHRDALRKEFLEAISCFQGDGRTPFAIDTSRVAAAFELAQQGSDLGTISFEDNSVASAFSEVSRSRLPTLVNRYSSAIKSIAPSLLELAGPDFRSDTPELLRNAIDSAKRVGVMAGLDFSATEIERLISSLEDPEIRGFVQKVANFEHPSEEKTAQERLAALARIDLLRLGQVHHALQSLHNLIVAIQRQADTRLRVEGGTHTSDRIDQMIQSLRSVGGAK